MSKWLAYDKIKQAGYYFIGIKNVAASGKTSPNSVNENPELCEFQGPIEPED